MVTPDLFDWAPPPGYPSAPGHKEPTTSRDAAEKVRPAAKTLRDQALGALLDAWPAGLTADQVAARLGRSELSIRPRITELRAQGAIEPSTRRAANASGMTAIVWVARRHRGGR